MQNQKNQQVSEAQMQQLEFLKNQNAALKLWNHKFENRIAEAKQAGVDNSRLKELDQELANL